MHTCGHMYSFWLPNFIIFYLLKHTLKFRSVFTYEFAAMRFLKLDPIICFEFFSNHNYQIIVTCLQGRVRLVTRLKSDVCLIF